VARKTAAPPRPPPVLFTNDGERRRLSCLSASHSRPRRRQSTHGGRR
jgi:hypothetical protein